MRVRLRVDQDNIDDFEFDNYDGIVMILEAMKKCVTNTDWLALEDGDLDVVLTGLEGLLGIFVPLAAEATYSQNGDQTGSSSIKNS